MTEYQAQRGAVCSVLDLIPVHSLEIFAAGLAVVLRESFFYILYLGIFAYKYNFR